MAYARAQRMSILVFVALVTCWLLCLVFTGAAAGAAGALELAGYALAAALGMEFLISVWPELWGDPPAAPGPGAERG